MARPASLPTPLNLLRRLIRWGVWLALWTFVVVTAGTLLWPVAPADQVARSDVILCLGAGMEADGTLDPASHHRVERCVDLYLAGVAPQVLFTGGRAAPDGPSAAGQMARLAQGHGLPEAAALKEPRAQSTLQNAIFSLDLLPPDARITLVTESFHMPRSWLSLKWAGAGRVTPVVTAPVADRRRPAQRWQMIPREVLAIWFNLARAGAYEVTGWLGMDPAKRIALLH